MKRSTLVLAVLAAALLGATPASGGGQALLIGGDEYLLTLSRAKVDPGKVDVDFNNSGEDAHNLLVRRKGSDNIRTIPIEGTETPAGGLSERRLSFKPDSHYVFWCSLKTPVDHKDAGMKSTLRVRNG